MLAKYIYSLFYFFVLYILFLLTNYCDCDCASFLAAILSKSMFNLFSKMSAKEEQDEKDSKFEIVDDDEEEEEDSAFLKSLKLNLSRLIGNTFKFNIIIIIIIIYYIIYYNYY